MLQGVIFIGREFLEKVSEWKQCGKLHTPPEKNVCFIKKKKECVRTFKGWTYAVRLYLLYFTALKVGISHILNASSYGQ